MFATRLRSCIANVYSKVCPPNKEKSLHWNLPKMENLELVNNWIKSPQMVTTMPEVQCMYVCSLFLSNMRLTRSPEALCQILSHILGDPTSFNLINRIHKKSCCKRGFGIGTDLCERICVQQCIVGTCTSRHSCISVNREYGLSTLDCFTEFLLGEKCICDANNVLEKNCSNSCNCVNGDCDYITGYCTCHPGYIGNKCSKECEDGRYGENCSQECMCENSSTCDKANGQCMCKPGYTGLHCENICPSGTWDENCSKTCECDNCRGTDGFCKCQENWNGTICSDYCPLELYNISRKECVENLTINREIHITNKYSMIFVSIFVTMTMVIILVLLFIYIKLTSLSKSQANLPGSRVRSSQDIHLKNDGQMNEHHYETISNGSTEAIYNTLCRPDERSDKFLDPTYFNGYECPHLGETVPLRTMSSEYVVLETNVQETLIN